LNVGYSASPRFLSEKVSFCTYLMNFAIKNRLPFIPEILTKKLDYFRSLDTLKIKKD
jgi:hypothetical protein